MDEIDQNEAEEILDQGERLLEDFERPDERRSRLQDRVDELRQAVEVGGDEMSEKAKDLRDFMESLDEGAIHDEPEMTPEAEREVRESGPREEEYAPDKTEKLDKTG